MILDIIFFAFIIVFAIVGFARGFFKTLVSLCGWLLCLSVSYLLAKSIANAILSESTVHWLVGEGAIYDKIYGIMPDELKELSLSALKSCESEELRRQLVRENSSGIMVLFSRFLQNAVCKEMYLSSSLQNAAQVLALELTYNLYVILVGVALFIVLRIVIMGVSLIVNNKFGGIAGKFAGKIGGCALGAIRGLMYASIVFTVLSLAAGFIPSVSKQLEASKVGAPATNWISSVTGNIISQKNEDNGKYALLLESLENRLSTLGESNQGSNNTINI